METTEDSVNSDYWIRFVKVENQEESTKGFEEINVKVVIVKGKNCLELQKDGRESSVSKTEKNGESWGWQIEV